MECWQTFFPLRMSSDENVFWWETLLDSMTTRYYEVFKHCTDREEYSASIEYLDFLKKVSHARTQPWGLHQIHKDSQNCYTDSLCLNLQSCACCTAGNQASLVWHTVFCTILTVCIDNLNVICQWVEPNKWFLWGDKTVWEALGAYQLYGAFYNQQSSCIRYLAML